MCKQLSVSRAAYYKWLHRDVPIQEQENIELANLIKGYDEHFDHILGYRRMTSWINHFNHTNYKKKRIHRIMKKLNIHSVIGKKKKKYLSSTPQAVAENILQRDFYATAPNQKWATDVTEFKVPGEKKKLYLSAIIDLYDRYPVSYVISCRNDNRLVFKTFDKAIISNPDANPSFIVIEASSILAKYFKESLWIKKCSNQCLDWDTVLIMARQKVSEESLSQKCMQCTK
jgi:putative transposase insK